MTRRLTSTLAVSLAAVVSVLILNACGGAQARKAKHFEKGQIYLAAGNFEKARVEFQNVLQIAPTDAEARFEMGVVNEKLSKIREAVGFYQGAISVNPDHVQARSRLARLFVTIAAPDRALEVLKPALDKNPDDAELLALRAAAHVQQKDLAGAQLDAERAEQLDPKNPDATATLAGIYSAHKDFDKAQKLLEDAIGRIPDTTDLRLVLAQLYASQNRLDDAEQLLLTLVQMRPAEKAHRVRLAQFYVQENKVDAAEQTLRDAIKALPQERDLKLNLVQLIAARRSPEAAEKELKAMIAADPKDLDMKFALAKFYQGTRQPALAESIYREVIANEKLDAFGLAARNRLAELRAQQNDLAGAEKFIGEVLAKSPRDDDALVLRGDISLAKKDPKSAIADLRAVLRDQPNAIPVLRTLASAHLANGEPAIAEETMRRALDANPRDPNTRLELALLLTQLGKPEQAKSILADLVKEQPGDTRALDALFRVGAATNDLPTAKSAAQAIVATQPKSALGYLYEGMLAEQEKKTDEALRLYAQAVELAPETREPLEAQIRLLTAQKRIPEALKRLDEVGALTPKAPLAPNMKGDLLASLGRTAEAKQAYELALSRAPKGWLTYRGLANLQFVANDPAGALATLRKGQAVADQPEFLALEIAGYFERGGKVDDAIREYDDILLRNPQSEVAANNLAMLLVDHRSDSASFDRAKTITSRFAQSRNLSFLDTYGWVLYKHGEATASVPVLEQVVAKSPNAAEARYHLGMALARAGNNAAARDNLTRAVDSGAKFSWLAEAKATLEKLAKAPADSKPKT
jgi:tetratricopeptide (TPR) repeat protein